MLRTRHKVVGSSAYWETANENEDENENYCYGLSHCLLHLFLSFHADERGVLLLPETTGDVFHLNGDVGGTTRCQFLMYAIHTLIGGGARQRTEMGYVWSNLDIVKVGFISEW